MSTRLWGKQKVIDRMKRDICKYLGCIPLAVTDRMIMEYAASKRILNSGPRQGAYDPTYTPYLIEPIDSLSINTTIQRVIFLKSAQIGFTTGAENLICYYMDEHPAAQLYLSGTEKLLKSWAEEKLEPAIDSFGIRKNISAQTENKKTKRTGDVGFMKMYHGYTLDLVSARSASGLRNKPKQILVRDEIDSAPRSLATGEGNYLDVSYVRTNAFGDRRKILDGSTPTTEYSLIYEEYLTGDQRKYMVPCPVCGAYQFLEFGDDYTEHGFKGEINENGYVTDAYYVCIHCKQKIEEHNKTFMLSNGYWEATAISQNRFWRSYSINTLYAPLGMIGWNELYGTWQKSKEIKEKLISFTNLYMGMPYIDESDQIEISSVMDSESNYKSGEVPEGVLFLTAGVDVQIGSKVNKRNPPRIEMEILGHGRNYRTWSIEYKIFYGETKDAYSGAFEEMYQWMLKTKCMYKTMFNTTIGLSLGLIDSGEGRVLMPVVYEFCKRTNGLFMPSKGFYDLKRKPGDKWSSDVPGSMDKVKYKIIEVDGDTRLVNISTVYYKDSFFSNLNKSREEGNIQKPGYCEFPNDYTKRYFLQLTSEVKSKEDGSYSNQGRRNEALDCRIYGVCAGDVFLDFNLKKMRDNAIKKGMTKEAALQKIRTPSLISLLERNIDKQRISSMKKTSAQLKENKNFNK
jgi:phage terminase large subunit GpA-like protein